MNFIFKEKKERERHRQPVRHRPTNKIGESALNTK